MSAMYALILDLALVTSMVGHALARRPQISTEELFQKSPSGSDAAAAAPGAPSSLVIDGGANRPAAVAVAAKSSCYFNRDCHAREYCVKPDRGALTLGVCSPLSADTATLAARGGAADHVRDLHFLVRNRRSVPASSPRRGTNELLRQLLGEGSQLARALNSYLHARYPAEWEKVHSREQHDELDRMVGKERGAAAKDTDSAAEDTVDPDLLAILDKGSNRIVEAAGDESPVARGSSASRVDSKDDGRRATSGSEADDRQNDVVVDVKENDMASGPKRRRMTRPPNSLR
ncbi:uncharacterized protein [Dermacentor albipictus]|uniref:uncharacterized protein n=1 Tax=Dermacentor albipictus TaxID=60249 RepID=UPI0038FC2FC9